MQQNEPRSSQRYNSFTGWTKKSSKWGVKNIYAWTSCKHSYLYSVADLKWDHHFIENNGISINNTKSKLLDWGVS